MRKKYHCAGVVVTFHPYRRYQFFLLQERDSIDDSDIAKNDEINILSFM